MGVIAMRKLLIVAGSLILAGCASEYDHSAYTSANAAQQAGMDRCNARAQESKDGSASHLMSCYMEVQGRFASAIRLKRMDVFENYRSRSMLLAQQVDSQHIPASEFFPRYGAIKADFNAAILSQEAADQASNAAAWNGVAAAGSGMQSAGAALQADTPRPYYPPAQPMIQPPLNCRTVFVANIAQTQCY